MCCWLFFTYPLLPTGGNILSTLLNSRIQRFRLCVNFKKAIARHAGLTYIQNNTWARADMEFLFGLHERRNSSQIKTVNRKQHSSRLISNSTKDEVCFQSRLRQSLFIAVLFARVAKSCYKKCCEVGSVQYQSRPIFLRMVNVALQALMLKLQI